MEDRVLKFRSVPIGSLSLIKEREKVPSYFERVFSLQPRVRNMLYSVTTGAYLRGVARTFNIQIEQAPQLALAVLRVAVGETTLAQLPSVISSELRLPNDKAQGIAQDIEKELFAPVMLEYNQSLQAQKATPKMPPGGAQNVLNLKAMKPPLPPNVPRQQG